MRRLLAALAAWLLLVVPAVAHAADTGRSKAEQRVYDDYRDDGVVTACDHPESALKSVLDGITPQEDTDTPDFRPAIEAAVEQHDKGDCQGDESGSGSSSGSGSGSGSSSSGSSGSPSSSGSTSTPSSSGSSSSGATSNGGPAAPLESSPSQTSTTPDLSTTPLPPEDAGDPGAGSPTTTTTTPAPTPVPTPVTTTATPPATAPVAPAATPALVYQNRDDPIPTVLLALGALLALLALLGLLYAVASRFGWGDEHLVRVRRAGREAAFRAGGLWGDFGDWLRAGR